ncbi:MAG TPA: hypothetical protein VLA35_05690 [Thermoleophilia bacterium]|nr:hypothetical protein [Thermoleophilia bacterium]
MDFFDDDAQAAPSPTTSAPPPPPRRRRGSRSRRWQRIAVAVVVLAVVAFALTWLARSCQHNRKISSYRDYMTAVDGAITDSEKLGKQLNGIVSDPTKLKRADLIARLEQMAAKHEEIDQRVRRFEPPGPLAEPHDALVAGMTVRTTGFELWRDAMLAVLDKREGVDAAALARLEGYFAGPDASYAEFFYAPARAIMADEGVTDVAVPTADWFLKTTAFERARLDGMIEQLRSSARMTGVRGVALAKVSVEPGGTVLKAGETVDVPASAQFSFRVSVENQGNVIERDVPITLTLTVPGAEAAEQTTTIGVIQPGATQSVDVSGFSIPAEAISKTCTLKVQAGPVTDEKVLDNNRGTFKFLLQIQ